MPCSRKEAVVKLFYNVTTIAKFFFLFFYLFSLFVAKIFTYFFRTEDDDEYEDEMLYEDEDEEEEEITTTTEVEDEEDELVQEYMRYSYVGEEDHLVAHVVNDGEALVFVPKDSLHDHSNSDESVFQDPVEVFKEEVSCFESSSISSSEFDGGCNNDDIVQSNAYEVENEDYALDYDKSNYLNDQIISGFREEDESNIKNDQIYEDFRRKSPIELLKYGFEENNNDATDNKNHGEKSEEKIEVAKKEDANFTRDDKFLIFAPPKSDSKKMNVDMEKEKERMFEDTYTIGSTSKSSSEWRSSIRDSCTDDPFSSSSRRSCPKWESYAVYQKYDEEMMFLDRISAQKLHETESLKSFQVEPRSISQRIVHKLGNKKKPSSGDEIYKNNPYNELEVAYVAQICLTWEALNWNYVTFKRKLVSKTELVDPGCPAYIAQQFQQFQVLLQRYNENEPYQRGKRPEIYARMRGHAPKLLQVPEYHDYEGEEKELSGGRIASTLFLEILEDSIQTFMNFLKADRESHCQVITSFFKIRPRGSIDPTVLKVFKKCNKKKKLKLNELQRSCICFKKRNLTREEEMEILMSLIDLKVVSRVLRMAEITQEQLHWCEDKMGKIRIFEGKKLQRDSSPLFFPAH
ncbi:uncharacterized protein LOC110740236 isoform X2 [Chenopodium quinoa]|uniref:uncharacterized protein LOC110701625 isoform X2 n=1 Tax=Chenopodium quinoa TaxID=63459 RepID=UPI000B773ED7|nr:uncharacterized protein LOC110701625 isoform X2 [Chenopodium quinoa]XP_021776414.1 uncharacterized protein LOC110740236 isoform X2 [Chenopodium quinoa]